MTDAEFVTLMGFLVAGSVAGLAGRWFDTISAFIKGRG